MAGLQTTIQNSNTFWTGSGKIEIQEYGSGSWLDLGGADDIALQESFTKTPIRAGNIIKPVEYKITEQNITMSFSLLEWNFDVLKIMRDGISTYSSVAGTPVPGAEQTVASGDWAFNKFILIENQNGDGSAITVNSVTGGTDSTLSEDTDYYVGQNDDGEYGIFIIDSVDVTTEDQALTINYDYTPNASKTLTGKVSPDSPTAFKVRITNENSGGDKAYFYLFNVTINGGQNFPLPNEDATDYGRLPLELICEPDSDNDEYWYMTTERV